MTRVFYTTVILVGLIQIGRSDDSPKGLVQSRFVTSEHISAPTGISVSPRGVVYVSCDINGTTNKKRKVGKVVRCEDTDGDGKADKFTDFVDGIDSPRGSCFVGNTLYLMQSPFLIAYQDLDQDGVADQKTTLVKNLGPSLRQSGVIHGANGVCMGIDGWLYLAIGDQGCYQATGTDNREVTLFGGGVLRVKPDGTQLTKLVSGTRNIYDIAVDPYLNLFACDNTNDGGGWGTRIHHLVELADFGYPHLFKNFDHEAMPSLADYGAGASTAMYYLQEPGFPKEYRNALYSGDLNTGLAVHRLRSAKATFQVTKSSFLSLNQNIGIDADGSSRMYCASRSGGGFGFANQPFGHVDIIMPIEKSGSAEFPDLTSISDKDLVSHLQSPSQVTRINTMHEMVVRGPRSEFTQGTVEIANDRDRPLYARVAAVMTLKQIDGEKSHSALVKLYDDPELREYVVRALGDVSSELNELSEAICLRALNDESPRVQIQGIIGLARFGNAKNAAAILPLASSQTLLKAAGEQENVAKNSSDKTANKTKSKSQKNKNKDGNESWSTPSQILPHIALKAVIELNAVDMLLNNLNDTSLQEASLRALQEIHNQKVVAGLTNRLESSNDKQLVKQICIALFRLYHDEASWDGLSWWRNRPNTNGPYFNAQTWEQTPQVKAAIELAFKKVEPSEYRSLFKWMRMNQIPEKDLDLDIRYDEALSLLSNKTLTNEEFNLLMKEASNSKRPEKERLQIYNYFKRGSLPESYFNRVQILRKWKEGRAAGKLQQKAYAQFVGGKEFEGNIEGLAKFLGESEKDCYKYAHIQLINLINDSNVSSQTRNEAKAELEKTWADKKNIYPHRLRGLMLAFDEVDPTPYAKQLKPLVDHRDERTKQGAARYLQAIQKGKK